MNAPYSELVAILANSIGARSVALSGKGLATDELATQPPIVAIKDNLRPHTELIVSVNELEKCRPEVLESKIAKHRDRSAHIVFVIATIFSSKTDDKGFNTHKIIKPKKWWRDYLSPNFPEVYELPEIEPHMPVFLTWTPDPATRKALRRLAIHIKWRRRIASLTLRTILPARIAFHRFMSEKALTALIEDKVVALVGNAESLSGKTWGADIDTCDIVVRCNRSPIISTMSHGSRTDWIAMGIDVPEEIVVDRRASVVLWTSPVRKRFPSWLFRFPFVYLYPRAQSAEIARKIGGRPSTGISAIAILARSQCREIRLYGFDFFNGRSLSGNHTRENTPHNFSGEQEYVARIIANDKRFTFHP